MAKYSSVDTDENLENAFSELLFDKESSAKVNDITTLLKELRLKGFDYGRAVLERRINPNLAVNKAVGWHVDLANSDIKPEKLKAFECGTANYTGYFNHKFFEWASELLPPGYITLPIGEKTSRRMNNERDKHIATMKKSWADDPERREKMRIAITGKKRSEETKRKMSESAIAREDRKRQSQDIKPI